MCVVGKKSCNLWDFNSILCAMSLMSPLMLGLFFSEQTAVCMHICSCCVTVSQAFCYVGDPTCQEKEHSKAQSTQDIHKDDLYVKKKGTAKKRSLFQSCR